MLDLIYDVEICSYYILNHSEVFSACQNHTSDHQILNVDDIMSFVFVSIIPILQFFLQRFGLFYAGLPRELYFLVLLLGLAQRFYVFLYLGILRAFAYKFIDKFRDFGYQINNKYKKKVKNFLVDNPASAMACLFKKNELFQRCRAS